ncbi:uncharacterized protein BCR38DRAFT_379879 [Pseudomassariella vexata]|uniref:DUF1993 domain-containing protein n=1 Tax=Pseudomassariella vexata TaxID=1141098 RepID=A0A1Y2D9D5_9PEZI|nr:uncharacterized protein BCR38DRAFT_379879 [Pseudomassariella vexata]ORY55871.1 hypothetical protein BCR38DRAFT_379879 [Pseudomassariella vexata]
MTSLYKQSIPVFTKYLNNLSHLLKMGAAHADEKAIKHDDIINFRLISDMRGLAFHVQSCCNTAVWFADRVGNLPHTPVDDNETTFEDFQARIESTLAYLEGIKPEVLDDKLDKPVVIEAKSGNFKIVGGQAYFSECAMPNFHFHLTTAYCLLRTQGVPVGALDYLKDVFVKE